MLCPITNLVREIKSERYRISQVNEAKARDHNQNSITPELKISKAQIENNIIWLSSNYGLFQYNTITSVLKFKNVKGEVFLSHNDKLILQDPFHNVLIYDDFFSEDEPT